MRMERGSEAVKKIPPVELNGRMKIMMRSLLNAVNVDLKCFH
jgi:hypothetical protein